MEEDSESLNFCPYDISIGDLLDAPYDISIGDLLDSEDEAEVKPKLGLVPDVMSGPQEEVDLVEAEADSKVTKVTNGPKRKKNLSRKNKVVWQEKQPNKRDERGERSKRQAGFDERSSLETVKKRIKRVRSQEVGEKGEERWEEEGRTMEDGGARIWEE